MKCTWLDCTAEAQHPQTAIDGDVWANLCEGHKKLLDESMTARSAKVLLSSWVKAQGGAKAVAARMVKV